jgi:hypothetical protein
LAESATVNRVVAGSSPALGAMQPNLTDWSQVRSLPLEPILKEIKLPKAYLIQALVIDFEGMRKEDIVEEVENRPKYSSPNVLSIQGVDLGEWNDDHPLNKHATQIAEVERLFGVKIEANS